MIGFYRVGQAVAILFCRICVGDCVLFLFFFLYFFLFFLSFSFLFLFFLFFFYLQRATGVTFRAGSAAEQPARKTTHLTVKSWVLLGFTGFYWVLLGFSEFHGV